MPYHFPLSGNLCLFTDMVRQQLFYQCHFGMREFDVFSFYSTIKGSNNLSVYMSDVHVFLNTRVRISEKEKSYILAMFSFQYMYSYSGHFSVTRRFSNTLWLLLQTCCINHIQITDLWRHREVSEKSPAFFFTVAKLSERGENHVLSGNFGEKRKAIHERGCEVPCGCETSRFPHNFQIIGSQLAASLSASHAS
jgi:hypothetical protein